MGILKFRRFFAIAITAVLFSAIPAVAQDQRMFQDEEFSGDVFFTAFFGNAEVTHPGKPVTVNTYRVKMEPTGLHHFTQFGVRPVPVYRMVVVPEQVVLAGANSIEGPYESSALGGGLAANYFFLRYLGLGLEGACFGGERSADENAGAPRGSDTRNATHDGGRWCAAEIAMGTFSLRYPIEGKWHMAPYLTVGIGGQFADTNRTIGCVGAGIERRFTPRTGIFVDGRYVFDGARQNVAQMRLGIRFLFGSASQQ